MKTTLITGCAGFIGSTLCKFFINQGHSVIGIDNLVRNYPVKFKKHNLAQIKSSTRFNFYPLNVLNYHQVQTIILKHQPQIVFHLAALTGVRASLQKSQKYFETNVIGTKNIYQLASSVKNCSFVFTSSSSVYGNSSQIPFTETQELNPLSPYAKSKFAAEKVIKKLYSRLKIPTTILRLFSVYGPLGRPDMAPYLFTQAAFLNQPVAQFGQNKSARDYTFINDVITAFVKLNDTLHGFDIINIGNSSPITLIKLIHTIEKLSNRKIRTIKKPVNKIESYITYADISKAKSLLNWKPTCNFINGMTKFVNWYKQYRLSFGR